MSEAPKQMETAETQAEKIRLSLGNGLRQDPVLTTGKSLIETLVEDIQQDAISCNKEQWIQEGMRLAAGVANEFREDIEKFELISEYQACWYVAGRNEASQAILDVIEARKKS